MRPSRLLAIAWRDLRMVNSGKSWYKLPLAAIGLMTPAGAIPFKLPEIPDAPAIARGDIPPELASQIAQSPRALVTLEGRDPVVVRAAALPDATREALNSLPGEPRVKVIQHERPVPRPKRSLLVALLSVSLLTGPLAETLPGERSRRTLETLRTAAISRGELVVGKWLAWAGAASGTTLAVALSGALTGAQPLGSWTLGLPLTASCAVALGLWLGRDAPDEIAGAARTIRVIPVAALGMGTLAFLLSLSSPIAASLVPLGGAILLAGGLVGGVGPTLGAALSTGLATAGMLAHTAVSLDRVEATAERPWLRGLSAVAVAALLWWLPVVGPAMWAMAGNPDIAARLPVGAGLAAGGLLLGLYAFTEHLREHGELPAPKLDGVPRGAAVGVALAMAAGASGLVPFAHSDLLIAARLRLAAGLAPAWAGLPALFAVVLGQAAFFRGWLPRRLGVWGSALAWALIASPLDPARGLPAALALGLLASRHGLAAAVAAHLCWALLPVGWGHPDPLIGLALGVAAVIIALIPTQSRPSRLRIV